MNNYITTQGDMWDIIALKVYGDEKLMHKLIEANPEYRHIVLFQANISLNIPEMGKKTVSTASPPWKRGVD